jgi:hypothetical protein
MVRLTVVFVLLPAVTVHTLAFSWRNHGVSIPIPDAEMPQDLSISGLFLSS